MKEKVNQLEEMVGIGGVKMALSPWVAYVTNELEV